MKNLILKIIILTILSSSIIFASGWRLPESSSKSVALSGAYIANSNGADSTYYNPANMNFNENLLQVEASLMYVYLPTMKYIDNTNAQKNGETVEGKTFIPSIFITSKDYNNIRYGFSITVPGGLSRKWNTPYQKMYAEEFTLKIVEFNPTASYKISSNLSVGLGLRGIYSNGVVKSDGMDMYDENSTIGKPVSRDMEGETIAFGYNLALSYRPTEVSSIALTYRSNIDLEEEGNAKLHLSGTKVYDGGTSVTVPLPAVLALAYAHTFNKTTVEFEYDRTYWSKYKNLDFEYNSEIPTVLKAGFDNPKSRNWKDTNAYRLGITHQYNDKLILMLGFSKDGNPIPDKSVSFESPDYNSQTISFGFDYILDDKHSIGFGYLYSEKDDRLVSNVNPDGITYIDGKLEDAKAHLISVSYRKTF